MEALNCIRHSLYYAPNDMRDIPLISLANVMHRSGKYNDGQHQSTSSYPLLSLGLYNDAIIAANMALEISPSFVVSHFTLANIYTSKKDLEKAKLFYVVSRFIYELKPEIILSLPPVNPHTPDDIRARLGKVGSAPLWTEVLLRRVQGTETSFSGCEDFST